MTNSKNTKRALLLSVLSMMLCAAMLIGSTFAWFTDSVTSGLNKIVAGNLDVKLQYSTDKENWTDVTEETNMFKEDALWEPGYTEVVYLKVENAGTLALKYQFGINVADKVIGETADGEEIDLAKFIKFGVAKDITDAYAEGDAGRTAARAAVKDSAALISDGYTSEGHLAKGESAVLALVIYMPEEAGNEANYGKKQPEIYMGVNLVAAQDTEEEDGFNNQYDKDAVYPVVDAASTKTALENGGTVILGNDVDVAPTGEGKGLIPQMSVKEDTYLDLSGKTLGVATDGTDWTYTPALISVEENAVLTIDGNGVVNTEAGSNNSYGINVNGGTLIINDGTFYGALTAVQVQKGMVIINGGHFDLAPTAKAAAPQYAKYIVNVIDDAYKDGSATIQITGGTFVNFDPSANPEGAGTSYVAEGYKVVSEQQANGETWYTVVAND